MEMDETGRAQVAAAIDALWAKFRPQMEERLAVLEAANRALEAGELSAAERDAAHAAAHKLAGALGSFGLTRGTELAREAELMFGREDESDTASIARVAWITDELSGMIRDRRKR